MTTAIIIATGPSLTPEQLDLAKSSGFMLVGMNHVWRDIEVDHFIACNPEYYDEYWNQGLSETPCKKWTWGKATAEYYGINYIEGIWKKGFSTDPDVIHYGHSSGFQAPQIAVNHGATRLLLLGYDMSYAADYDGKNKRIGSVPRHYFGEYPSKLQHWPSVKVKNGVFIELIEQFEDVKRLNPDIEIINCTPGSAMTCFPMMSLEDAL